MLTWLCIIAIKNHLLRRWQWCVNVYETGMPLLRMETPQIEHNNILVHTSNSSTPPKLIFYEDGNGKFVFSDNDNCCFLFYGITKRRQAHERTNTTILAIHPRYRASVLWRTWCVERRRCVGTSQEEHWMSTWSHETPAAERSLLLLLITYLWHVCSNIQVDVESSPLGIFIKKLNNSKWRPKSTNNHVFAARLNCLFMFQDIVIPP